LRRRASNRISLAGALLLAAACAHVEPPPGGPEDREPPALLTTRPEDGAVVPRYDGPVLFVFDERISERGLEETVMVSPRTSPVEVRHGRNEIRVSLRQGWQPGMIYHVLVRPEVRDLFGNVAGEGARLVFSTGPVIPDTRVSGRVTDRITGRAEQEVRVEAIRSADSLVYAVPTDSAGRYELGNVPEGEYRIRAYRDLNRNRALDPFEPRDTADVTFRSGAPLDVALRVLMPDTTPPIAGLATVFDGGIVVEFDDFLDPDQEISPEQVDIRGPAGEAISVETVAVEDGAGSTGAGPRSGIGGDVPAGAGSGDVAPNGANRLPSRTLRIEPLPDVPLRPEAPYILVMRGIRNVNGLSGDSEATLETPPALPEPVVEPPSNSDPDPDQADRGPPA